MDPRGGNPATGFELWFVHSANEQPFTQTLNPSKSVQHWFASLFSSLSPLFSPAGYFEFIFLPSVTPAKGWRSLLSHTEFREMRKVSDTVCMCVGEGVCVHSGVSMRLARACACVKRRNVHSHTPVWSRASPAAPRDSTKGLLYPLYELCVSQESSGSLREGPQIAFSWHGCLFTLWSSRTLSKGLALHFDVHDT